MAFDRNQVNIDDPNQQLELLDSQGVDTIFHLATGPESWVATLAGLAEQHNLPFVFTSTESVFNPDSTGPFTPDHPADATSDYGRYKIACEKAAREANPNAIIARLGWQMFDTFEQDNLLTHVRDMHDEQGFIEASTEWIPAVAYIGDTMEALIQTAQKGAPGTFHIGGNEGGLSFYELVSLINRRFEKGWDVRRGTTPARDGRIVDERVSCGDIAGRF